MRFALSAEQRELANAVRDFLAKECTAGDVRRAWTDGLSHERWQHLHEMGMLDVASSFGLVEAAAVLRECGYAGLPEPVIEANVASICGLPVNEFVAIGLHAQLVPYALDAQRLILRSVDELFYVERPDFEAVPGRSVDGGRPVAAVTWEPTQAKVIDRDADTVFDICALGTAAFLVGVGQRMLDMAVEHAKVRHQFGRPIGSFQAIKHVLANVVVDLEFAWPLVLRAAVEPSPMCVAAAKAQASAAAQRAARTALQVHGAIGYTFEHDLHLWFKRAYVLAAAWGDAAFHQERVARELLDG